MLTNLAFKQALVDTGPAPVSDQVPSFLTK